MNLRVVAGVGLGFLVVPAIAGAQQETSDAERNWSAVAACGAIDNADRRLECVDRVLQQAGLLTPARVEQAAREEFGREGRAEARRPAAPVAAPAPAPSVASVATPAAAPAAAPRRAADIDELVTTVASVRTVGYRRLRVTTAEGSVWDQTQAENFLNDPRPGERFAVERAAMNSFLCQFGRAKRYRCERID